MWHIVIVLCDVKALICNTYSKPTNYCIIHSIFLETLVET
jgi:hypothetical protein